jgi:hypothetical protein
LTHPACGKASRGIRARRRRRSGALAEAQSTQSSLSQLRALLGRGWRGQAPRAPARITTPIIDQWEEAAITSKRRPARPLPAALATGPAERAWIVRRRAAARIGVLVAAACGLVAAAGQLASVRARPGVAVLVAVATATAAVAGAAVVLGWAAVRMLTGELHAAGLHAARRRLLAQHHGPVWLVALLASREPGAGVRLGGALCAAADHAGVTLLATADGAARPRLYARGGFQPAATVACPWGRQPSSSATRTSRQRPQQPRRRRTTADTPPRRDRAPRGAPGYSPSPRPPPVWQRLKWRQGSPPW